jgi:anti-anti-sigma factor
MAANLSEGFELSGDELELDEAEEIKESGRALIDASPGPFTVDLAGLENANSITVAVLAAWFRAAKLQDNSIVFVNLSAKLRDILQFSGLDEVLPGE